MYVAIVDHQKIPDGISFDEAASVPLALATVVMALWAKTDRSIQLIPPWKEGGLTAYARKPIFILGGSSSVGQYGKISRVSI